LSAGGLFGSYARGTATESSEIDLLTVDSLKQKAQMPSESDFRLAVNAGRKTIYAIA
jgi:predicted nucleotidyltransferase